MPDGREILELRELRKKNGYMPVNKTRLSQNERVQYQDMECNKHPEQTRKY